MILYFSGTGNSEYVAKKIGKALDDEVINLFEKIKTNDVTPINSDKAFVVVAPIYAWRIANIVENWLKSTPLTGSKDIYFLLTCGGSIGNATKYLKVLTDSLGMNYLGCAEIVMPENYIALFRTPSKVEALKIIERAEDSIKKTIPYISKGIPLPKSSVGVVGRMNSGIVNKIFYRFFVHANKFYATESCNACGKCVAVCPLTNITLKDKKPVWSDNCTHCMACICKCPQEAIEYGKNSKNQHRYVCPKKI